MNSNRAPVLDDYENYSLWNEAFEAWLAHCKAERSAQQRYEAQVVLFRFAAQINADADANLYPAMAQLIDECDVPDAKKVKVLKDLLAFYEQEQSGPLAGC